MLPIAAAVAVLLGIVDVATGSAKGENDILLSIKAGDLGATSASVGFSQLLKLRSPGLAYPEYGLAVLYYTLYVITYLEQFNGRAPDKGAKFTEGASLFFHGGGTDNVFSKLYEARVDRSRWYGDRADEYDDANTELRDLVNPDYAYQMMAADAKMQKIMARQATQIETASAVLATIRAMIVTALNRALWGALAFEGLPGVFQWLPDQAMGPDLIEALDRLANSRRLRCLTSNAEAIALIALLGAGVALKTLSAQADTNAAEIEEVEGEYKVLRNTANVILLKPKVSMRVPATPQRKAASGSAGSRVWEMSAIRSSTNRPVGPGAARGLRFADKPQLSQPVTVATQVAGPTQRLASTAPPAAPGKRAPTQGAATEATDAPSAQAVPIPVALVAPRTTSTDQGAVPGKKHSR